MNNLPALVYRKLDYRPWPVDVKLLVCDEQTGNVAEVENRFIAHFANFTEEEFAEAVKAAKAAVPYSPPPQPAAAATTLLPPNDDEGAVPIHITLQRNAKLFAALMVGWAKCVDEGNVPIPYSVDALTALVTGRDGLAVSAGINESLMQFRFGIAPAKNSNPSPSPGPASSEGEAPTS